MKHVRRRDIALAFRPSGALLVRATSSGMSAEVPILAIAVLSYCQDARTQEEVGQAVGPMGAELYGQLVSAGFLVSERQSRETPVFFDNFPAWDIHRRMLGDRVRLDAYARALDALVTPDSVVLDAGTGTGILACLAARAGARKVYGVDRSDILDLARQTAEGSGVADRVSFIQADLAEVQLPEKVDLIVTETFGAMCFAEGAAPDLQACVANNLAPGGRVVPGRVSVWLAPFSDENLVALSMGAASPFRGVRLQGLEEIARHRAVTLPVPAGALVGSAEKIVETPFPALDLPTRTVALKISRAAELHGFVAWFTLHLSDGVDLPTGPDSPVTHWHQSVLAMEPRPVSAGDTVKVQISIREADDERRALHVDLQCAGPGGVERGWFRVG